ncbi:CLUMA_CG007711, isoform A [Clunio marinus]|uniref:CLUMA_CG007711, isoform A n=1 Tax=Clunio marinus TaxID=568069 RepID=A0A1J1I1V9_9DIPT|nr:CLUMA_CG007711, isoform A [Clunio marinus]
MLMYDFSTHHWAFLSSADEVKPHNSSLKKYKLKVVTRKMDIEAPKITLATRHARGSEMELTNYILS